MNVSVDLGSAITSYGLHTALLLYGQGNNGVVMQHPVRADESGPFLGPGKFVTESFLEELRKLYSHGALQYVPPHVVAYSQSALAWYEPASLRTMFFRASGDQSTARFDGAALAQPPLLFVARGRGLAVYALSKDERPVLETTLCKAPYWNIFDDDRVCLGSMVLPKQLEPRATPEWTAAFFASEFTHLSSGKRWAHRGTYSEMLHDVQRTGAFDPAWLKPMNLTVEQALCGK